MTTTAAPPASSSTSTARPVCVDMNGVEREEGESWQQSCNTCTCSGGGPPVCTKMLCPPPVTVPPQPEPTTTIHVDPGSTSTDVFPCSVCSHCVKEAYGSFENELAIYEGMIQMLEEENKKLRSDEMKFLDKIKKLKGQNETNIQLIHDLEKQLASFQAKILNLEDQNESMKKEKNKLHKKIQNLEAENLQNLGNLREEMVMLLQKIKQLETDNKNCNDEKNKLLAKCQAVEDQVYHETLKETLNENKQLKDMINELEKKCKPECSSNTECPSFNACVRYLVKPLSLKDCVIYIIYMLLIVYTNFIVVCRNTLPPSVTSVETLALRRSAVSMPSVG